MSMSMGDTSSAVNVTNLPLSDPRCNSDACLAFQTAHTASQAAVSYYYQYEYGHFTTWYYLATIGVAMVAYGYQLYRNRHPPNTQTSSPKSSLRHKALAALRFVSYKHATGGLAHYLGLPSLGTSAYIAATALFLLLMTFLVQPYYRGHRGYGSPPIAVRTGLMAQALTPIIVALAGKVNIVTFLTGISHEKLNVFHRWASYMCLFLSIVHTVPFIVQPLWDGGPAALRAQYYKAGGFEYTGTPPLGMLVGLVVLSVPWIRHRFYNFFYRVHIPMYIAYLGLMFWHSGQEQDSWAYLWATLAVWLVSIFTRLFYKWQTFSIFRNWFEGFPATLQELDDDITRVSILAPPDFYWRPGQHCWLRMPHLSVMQNHPFTIANLPVTGTQESDKSGQLQEVVFYIRAERGLTRDLLASISEHSERSIPIHIDGPYGGLTENLPTLYESLIFVAGGSGISACHPLMQHATDLIAKGGIMCHSIQLIWMVRKTRNVRWISDELKRLMGVYSDHVKVDFYITGETPHGTDGASAARATKDNGSSKITNKELSTPTLGNFHYKRPFLPELLPRLITSRRVMVFGCGPESLLVDLSNAAATAQKKVLAGAADLITLHTESFGW